MNVLGRDFYLRDAKTVAKELLGKRLVRVADSVVLTMEISETEAYLGVDDPACHCFGGRRTPRTETMFGLGGHAYIYFVYGMHHMLNVVTGGEGDPCAVLIRGGLPLEGHDKMCQLRFQKEWEALKPAQKRSLADGPGKLAKALSLTRADNGLDLTASDLLICDGEPEPFTITVTPRIGIDYAGEAASWPLNFKLCRARQSRTNP